MAYGTYWFQFRKQHIHRMSVVKMKVLRWMRERLEKYIELEMSRFRSRTSTGDELKRRLI